MRPHSRSKSWKKWLLFIILAMTVFSTVAYGSSYSENQRLNKARAIQEKCIAAKSDITSRKTEFQTQTSSFYQNNKIEMESVQRTLSGLSGVVGSLGYDDNTARLSAISEINRIEERLSEIEKSRNEFKLKSDTVADRIETIELELNNCTDESPYGFDELKAEKYLESIDKAKSPVNLK